MDDEPLHNEEEPHVDIEDAVIQRRDDQKFMFEMEQLVQEAEDTRLRYMNGYRLRGFFASAITVICIIVGAGGFAWHFLMHADLNTGLMYIGSGIALACLLYLWKQSPIKSYKKNHKKTFMPKMARAMGGFKFFAQRGIDPKIVQKSGVIPPYKIYDSEDCFMGIYKGIKVIMSEARLYHDKKKQHRIFDGLFVLVELPSNSFSGHTIISADQALVQSAANTRWSSLQNVGTPKTDPAWKKFHIYSNKPDMAATQVTEPFLKELLEASEVFDNAPLSAVMMGKKFIFLTIPYEEDMFEASNIFVPVTLKSYMDKSRKEIEKLIEVIDIFELYSRDQDRKKQHAT